MNIDFTSLLDQQENITKPRLCFSDISKRIPHKIFLIEESLFYRITVKIYSLTAANPPENVSNNYCFRVLLSRHSPTLLLILCHYLEENLRTVIWPKLKNEFTYFTHQKYL